MSSSSKNFSNVIHNYKKEEISMLQNPEIIESNQPQTTDLSANASATNLPSNVNKSVSLTRKIVLLVSSILLLFGVVYELSLLYPINTRPHNEISTRVPRIVDGMPVSPLTDPKGTVLIFTTRSGKYGYHACRKGFISSQNLLFEPCNFRSSIFPKFLVCISSQALKLFRGKFNPFSTGMMVTVKPDAQELY